MDESFFPPPPAARKADPRPAAPAAREAEARPAAPAWLAPPYGVLPAGLALEVVLARNEQAAVFLGRCAAYPLGLELDLHVLATASADLDPSLNSIYHRPVASSTYESMLRFGVAFSDGRKASNVSGDEANPDEEPEGPVLWGRGGSGAGGRWRQTFWMWPLPPPGPLTFVCEWPAAGLAQTQTEIDSEPLRQAASRAQELYPNQVRTPRPEG